MTEYMKPFSHIYVEEGAEKYNRTVRILEKFPDAVVIRIRDYRDVFNRRNQNPGLQHNSQKLILAVKKDGYLYEGAPVCQSFGERDFFYTSNVMNCVYDCEYCFLKGMYPSSNMVIFVNLEDTFAEIDRLRNEWGKTPNRRIYISISYESDMLAVESITGMLADWAEWVEGKDDVLLELRTKCASKKALEIIEGRDQFILAITMSPDEVISKYEKFTPDLESRIEMAEEAIERKLPVRICLDPMMHIRDYRNVYANMINITFSRISQKSLRDVSIGSFRISKDYIKNFRKDYKNSSAAYFPYEIRDGYYQYPEDLRIEMEEFLYEKLLNYVPDSKIFRWK